MIEKLQKFFHTDRWLGRVLFVFVSYIIFWCVFYGSWLVMPDSWFEDISKFEYWVFLVYIFIFVPYLSFKLASLFKKIFITNYFFIATLNIIFLICSLYIFFRFIVQGVLS